MDSVKNCDQLRLTVRRKTSGENNLIPMINIVFLLLIFFMVAGQIQAQDGKGIQPPLADDTVGSTPTAADLQITRQNEILLDGQTVSAKQLATALAGFRQEATEQILIKADRDVSAKDLGELLDVLRASGVRNIRLLTQGSGN